MELHRVNRERLCKRLKENKEVPMGAVIVLQGGDAFQRYCTDVDVTTFRQVCYSMYLSQSFKDILVLSRNRGISLSLAVDYK